MGCDIHTYIEFADFTASDGGPYWKNFTLNGGSRNYVMFGVLAGVRVPEVQLFEPKGMPEGRLGYGTSDGYWMQVAPIDHPEWADHDGFVSLDTAVTWVEGKHSVGEYDKNDRLTRVSGPDWHSHSWLTTKELAEALDQYPCAVAQRDPTRTTETPPEWLAMLAAMQAFESTGTQVRLVFWFDN